VEALNRHHSPPLTDAVRSPQNVIGLSIVANLQAVAGTKIDQQRLADYLRRFQAFTSLRRGAVTTSISAPPNNAYVYPYPSFASQQQQQHQPPDPSPCYRGDDAAQAYPVPVESSVVVEPTAPPLCEAVPVPVPVPTRSPVSSAPTVAKKDRDTY
jgi:hypothetical protein